jgi:hypothetical protein
MTRTKTITKEEDKQTTKQSFTFDKDISGYRFKVQTDFNQLKSDYVLLILTASPELNALLNGITCKDEEIIEENVILSSRYIEERQTLKIKRYKVTRPLLSIVPQDLRALFFEKEFIDTGVLTIKITSFNAIDNILSDFRIGLKAIIEAMLKYSNLDATTTFKVS